MPANGLVFLFPLFCGTGLRTIGRPMQYIDPDLLHLHFQWSYEVNILFLLELYYAFYLFIFPLIFLFKDVFMASLPKLLAQIRNAIRMKHTTGIVTEM